MEIISTIALISINETLIVQVLSFLIFLFVINRVMFKPLRGTMAERQAYMDDLTKDIDQAREKIAEIERQIGSQEAKARREAMRAMLDLEDSGTREAEAIFAATSREIGEMSRKIHAEVEAQLADARRSVRNEAEIVARGIIAKILDRSQPL